MTPSHMTDKEADALDAATPLHERIEHVDPVAKLLKDLNQSIAETRQKWADDNAKARADFRNEVLEEAAALLESMLDENRGWEPGITAGTRLGTIERCAQKLRSLKANP